MVGGNKGYAFIVPPDGWELLLTKSVETKIHNDNKTNNENIDFIYKLDIDFVIFYLVMGKTIRLLKRLWKLLCGLVYIKSDNEFYYNLIIITYSFVNHIICSNIKWEEYDESEE